MKELQIDALYGEIESLIKDLTENDPFNASGDGHRVRMLLTEHKRLREYVKELEEAAKEVLNNYRFNRNGYFDPTERETLDRLAAVVTNKAVRDEP